MKLPFVSMSANGFLVSMYLIWISGIQINPIEQPIKSNSVVSGNMSHFRASSLYDHLDHCFVVYNKASWWQELTFEGIKPKLLITPWDCFRFWIVWGVERTSRLFINLFYLSSFRGCEDSRHELVQPYASKWTSGIATNSCPRETFLLKPSSSQALANWKSFWRFSNFLVLRDRVSSGCRIPNWWFCEVRYCLWFETRDRSGARTIFLQFLARGMTPSPFGNLLADAATSEELDMQISSFPSFLKSMSLNIDMKMIRSLNCSGWFLFSSIVLWTSWRTSVWCALGNFSTRTRLVLRQYCPAHDK